MRTQQIVFPSLAFPYFLAFFLALVLVTNAISFSPRLWPFLLHFKVRCVLL